MKPMSQKQPKHQDITRNLYQLYFFNYSIYYIYSCTVIITDTHISKTFVTGDKLPSQKIYPDKNQRKIVQQKKITDQCPSWMQIQRSATNY